LKKLFEAIFALIF